MSVVKEKKNCGCKYMTDSHELEENAPDYMLGLFKWHQNHHHKSKKPKETVIYALAEGNQAAR